MKNTAIDGILIDPIDADLELSRWSLTSNGYPRRSAVTFGGRPREARLNRIIGSRIANRTLSKLEEVDHIDGNRLDNRRSNLRIASHHQNMMNRRSVQGSSSKFLGVAWHKGAGKWRAMVMIDDKQHHIGLFLNEEEAAWMRDQWAIALHGDFASLNFSYSVLGVDNA